MAIRRDVERSLDLVEGAPADQLSNSVDEGELRTQLAKMSVEPRVRDIALEMALGSPARSVGKGALRNSIVRMSSQKNATTVIVESRSVEYLCALEFERDAHVRRYFSQVPCAGVERNFGAHVSKATVDFMVWRADAVELIECKNIERVRSLANTKPQEWEVHGDGTAVHRPLSEWASSRGMRMCVWMPREYCGVYLSNMIFMYEAARLLTENEVEMFSNMVRRVARRGSCSIDQLAAQINGFTPKVAAALLWARRFYGPIECVLITSTQQFVLYLEQAQAEVADAVLHERVLSSAAQTADPVLCASAVDVRHGLRRLRKVELMLAGELEMDKNLVTLSKEVQEAKAAGQNPLVPCLTSFHASGNRFRRLSRVQLDVMNTHVADWEAGRYRTVKAVHLAVRDACAFMGERGPSYPTVREACKATNVGKRALATGGLRKFQQIQPASDPLMRTLPPQARFSLVQIDSTPIDNRSFPNINGYSDAEAPRIYIALDCSTNECLAHAFIFGAARRDGLALLMRDMVRRHGRLPFTLQLDRGPENKSNWLCDFADRYYVSVVFNPTARHRSNGQVENLVGRVNSMISHALCGSTRPDQAGRAVDGRYKSASTARLSFGEVSAAIEEGLYSHLDAMPGRDGYSPLEKRGFVESAAPASGMLQVVNDEFRFRTSVPASTKTFDPLKGIRVEEQTFNSEALQNACAVSRILEVRPDCEDASLLWVQTERGVVKAWSRDAQGSLAESTEDRVFQKLYSPLVRSRARKDRTKAERDLNNRITKANAMPKAVAMPDVAPANTPLEEKPKASSSARRCPIMSFDEIEDLPEG